ncbi:ComF family protein, partial [Candidatus Peregrinibacteria bacterium]|nr:ComF family protein [Candidatus Peregrinibacteria bacterium]
TRTRPTGHQARRTRSERLVALNGAFKCVAERSDSNKTVILVDDLSTTGATLNACAKTLKEAGFNNVIGWVVAHG